MIDYHIRWKKEAELESQRLIWGEFLSEIYFGPIDTNLNKLEQVWTSLNKFEQVWASLNKFEQVSKKLLLNKFQQVSTGLEF